MYHLSECDMQCAKKTHCDTEIAEISYYRKQTVLQESQYKMNTANLTLNKAILSIYTHSLSLQPQQPPRLT